MELTINVIDGCGHSNKECNEYLLRKVNLTLCLVIHLKIVDVLKVVHYNKRECFIKVHGHMCREVF